LAYESEKLLAKKEGKDLLELIDRTDMPLIEGKEKERMIKVRVNQYLFRTVIMASYNSTCCITGLRNPELLVASHIASWAENKKDRMNPQNGLCLNALHDRAFDKYLITVTPDFKIKLSNKLKAEAKNKAVEKNFIRYQGQPIILPQKFMPHEEFLLVHNEKFEKLD
jgi:putative restriction endonuclease